MAKKTTSKKKKIASKKVIKKSFFKRAFERKVQRARAFLARRPHRSFRMTNRRDYVRSLKVPGYWAFTNLVRELLWKERKLFMWVVLIYGLLVALFVGIASQDNYTTLSDTLRQTSTEVFQEGTWGDIGKAGLLLAVGASGNINAAPTEVQQIYSVFFGLLVWLTTVWLLRAVLAGKRPRFRDGLYSAGAPIISTALVLIVLAVQLLPLALAVLSFTAASSTGFLNGGVESMIFFVVALLLVVVSLYWSTATLIALVVITLPGMYPMQALKTAGDLVIGRRLRILLRFLWMVLITAATWIFIMVPVIIFDTWLKAAWPATSWLPFVPVSLLIVSSLSIVWVAGYTYLFYRKVVEDDSAPA